MEVKVAAIQTKYNDRIFDENVRVHRPNFVKWLRQAYKRDVDIVCFPECHPHFNIDVARKLAKEYSMYIVFCRWERQDKNKYNIASLINRSGEIVGNHKKIHLAWGEDKEGFVPGDDFNVFKTDFGKIGIAICAEFWREEFSTILALKGAEMIFNPSIISPWCGDYWKYLTIARCLDQCVPVVTSNTTRVWIHSEKEYHGCGGSMIVVPIPDKTAKMPLGELYKLRNPIRVEDLVLAKAGEKEGIITAKINPRIYRKHRKMKLKERFEAKKLLEFV